MRETDVVPRQVRPLISGEVGKRFYRYCVENHFNQSALATQAIRLMLAERGVLPESNERQTS